MKNPLYHLLSDGQYQCLVELKLLHKNRLRDFEMKNRYLVLKKEGRSSDEVFDQLCQEYPRLKTETIKKIVYSTRIPEGLQIQKED